MPQITQDRIDDFIIRWEISFGERLTREAAFPIATRLVELYRMLHRQPAGPMEEPKDEAEAPLIR